ncbi:hypothetical protein ACKVV1_003405 [Pyricularia oryzae]
MVFILVALVAPQDAGEVSFDVLVHLLLYINVPLQLLYQLGHIEPGGAVARGGVLQPHPLRVRRRRGTAASAAASLARVATQPGQMAGPVRDPDEACAMLPPR